MSAPRKATEFLAAAIYPIMGLGVIAMIVVGLRKTGWTFRGLLSDVVGIIWPMAFLCGLLFLVAATASKETKDLAEAYLFMRRAAISFLLSTFTLWLVFRSYV